MDIFLSTSRLDLLMLEETRNNFDAIPNLAIPANVIFVSPLSQFTPKDRNKGES